MLYELICSVNQRLVMGENVDEEEKRQIIDAILSEPDYTHMVSKEKYVTARLRKLCTLRYLPCKRDRASFVSSQVSCQER